MGRWRERGREEEAAGTLGSVPDRCLPLGPLHPVWRQPVRACGQGLHWPA